MRAWAQVLVRARVRASGVLDDEPVVDLSPWRREMVFYARQAPGVTAISGRLVDLGGQRVLQVAATVEGGGEVDPRRHCRSLASCSWILRPSRTCSNTR